MAKKKEAEQPRPAEEGPRYPHIEAFAEQAGSEDVVETFAPLKESLAGVKGPRAEAAKKAAKGVAATEQLLMHLLEVREKIKADRKGSR